MAQFATMLEQSSTGRPRDSLKTKQILDATRRLIVDQGIGVTIDQIARAAGVSRDAVYTRWPTRRDVIVTAALDLVTDEVPVPDTGSLRDDLLVLISAFAHGLTGGFGRVYRSMLAEADRDPLWQPVLVSVHQNRRAATAVILERGVARGELTSLQDGDQLLDFLAGILWYRFLISYDPKPEHDLAELVDRAVAAFTPPPSDKGRPHERDGRNSP